MKTNEAGIEKNRPIFNEAVKSLENCFRVLRDKLY